MLELRLTHTVWLNILPLVQSAISNGTILPWYGIPPSQAMTRLAPSPLYSAFYRSRTGKPIMVTEVNRERLINISVVLDLVNKNGRSRAELCTRTP